MAPKCTFTLKLTLSTLTPQPQRPATKTPSPKAKSCSTNLTWRATTWKHEVRRRHHAHQRPGHHHHHRHCRLKQRPVTVLSKYSCLSCPYKSPYIAIVGNEKPGFPARPRSVLCQHDSHASAPSSGAAWLGGVVQKSRYGLGTV